MTFKKLIFSGSLILGSVSALAENGNGRERMMQILKQLDLNGEQRQKIKAVREQQKNEIVKLREDVKNLRQKMKEQIRNSASDSNLKTTFNELQSKQKQMAEKRFGTLLEIRKVLTDEQKKKLSELSNKN